MSPHLIVKLKSLHVHTQEPGIHFELARLISRTDVKDHVSEAVRNRVQNGDCCLLPGSQSHSSTHCSSPRAVPCHGAQTSPLSSQGPALSCPSFTFDRHPTAIGRAPIRCSLLRESFPGPSAVGCLGLCPTRPTVSNFLYEDV